MMPECFGSMQNDFSIGESCSVEKSSEEDHASSQSLNVAATCESAENCTQSKGIDASQSMQRMLPLGRRHAFWETQPVEQFKDREGIVNQEGPISAPRSVAEVRTEPYRLPTHYEWCTCDLNCMDALDEIYNLLSNHYVEDFESMFRYNYSKEFLQWALQPPGYYPSWHIGVRVEATKRLVAFITAIPVNMRLRRACMQMAEVNFLCIHRQLRSKRLAPLLIKEATRRVHLENIWQAIYTAGVVLPTPVVTCQYWHRPLNLKKLVKVGFSQLGLGLTMGQTIKHYQLPQKTVTLGLRPMERKDVPAVTQLLQQYLSQFVVAPVLSVAEVEHWLLPVKNVVSTFVVEDADSYDITDFCSFYTLSSAVLGDPNYKTLKAAYLYYNVVTKTPLTQMVNDLLIMAKKNDYDVFNVLDVMQNHSFLQELKFKLGDGHLQYYLYNYRLKEPISPQDLAVILL